MGAHTSAVAALRAHRDQQASEQHSMEGWTEHGLVFCSTVGTPLDPANVRSLVRRVVERAGIERDAFPYLMRHSVVSHLLDNGHSIEEVADLAGDDPQTLYRHYRHRTRPVAIALLAMEDLLGA